MSNIKIHIEKFKLALKKEGLKFTEQRFQLFKFLYKKDKTINLIIYIIIHFFFCFSVSLGALLGLFNYSFYRIFK